MDIVTLKVISFVAILAIAVIGGLIPLLSAKSANSERFFSLGNAFAGGLFLGVGFIHLLPEGIEMLSAYSDFPWGAVTATVGFAALLLIDRIMFPEYQVGESLRESGSESIYPYVLLAMLSIHSIVAGIALGLEEKIAGAVTLLIGIVFHKGPAAFALILSTHMAGIQRSRQKVFLAFFCVMTPLGIVLGVSSSVVLAGASNVYGVMQGVFSAFAAGTFIYIAVIDIIDKELTTHQIELAQDAVSTGSTNDDLPTRRRSDDRLVKFLLIVVGIVLVAFINEWSHAPHMEHDHSVEYDAGHRMELTGTQRRDAKLETYHVAALRVRCIATRLCRGTLVAESAEEGGNPASGYSALDYTAAAAPFRA